MLLKIIAELKTKRILFKACTLSKKRLKYGSKKVNKNTNLYHFSLAPSTLHNHLCYLIKILLTWRLVVDPCLYKLEPIWNEFKRNWGQMTFMMQPNWRKYGQLHLQHFLLTILLEHICEETIFHSLAVSLLACFFASLHWPRAWYRLGDEY